MQTGSGGYRFDMMTGNLTLDNSTVNITNRTPFGPTGTGTAYAPNVSIGGRFTVIGNPSQDTTAMMANIGQGSGEIMTIDVEHGLNANATFSTTGAFYVTQGMIAVTGNDLNGTGTYKSKVIVGNSNGYMAGGIWPFIRILNSGTAAGWNFAARASDGSVIPLTYTGTAITSLVNPTTTSSNVLLNSGSEQYMDGSRTVNSLKTSDTLNLNSGILTLSCYASGAPLIATGSSPIRIYGGDLKAGAAAGYYYVTNDTQLTLDCNLNQGAGLIKNGTGKLIINGAFTGTTITFIEGSLEYRSSSTQTVTLSGFLQGHESILIDTPATVTTGNGANGYCNLSDGGITIVRGTFKPVQGYGNNAAGTGLITVASTGTLSLSSGNILNPVQLNGGRLSFEGGSLDPLAVVEFAAGQTCPVNSVSSSVGYPPSMAGMTGSGTMLKTGTGWMTFSAQSYASSFTGDIVIQAGAIEILANNVVPASAERIIIGSAGVFWMNQQNKTVAAHTFMGSGTVVTSYELVPATNIYNMTSAGCTWAPGMTPGAAGILTWNGQTLTMATAAVSGTTRYSRLEIDVVGSGTTAGTDYDRFVLTAPTTANGLITSLTNCQLALNVANGLDLSGKVYTILTTNSNLLTAGNNTRFRSIDYGSNILASSATVTYVGTTSTGFAAIVTGLQYAPGLISGLKFSDSNGNGTQDAGEPALANWPINLTVGGSVVLSTTTDGAGAYSFNLSTSNSVPFTITEGSATGWRQTSTPGGIVGPGGSVSGLALGNQQLSILSGMKFNDANHNGVKDTGELGLEGWTISLFNNSGTVTAVTDTNGAYSFANVIPGSYTLTETGSTGWTQSFPVSGSWAGTVDSGATLANLDFGNYVAVTDIPGDINRDHIVDQADYTVWYNHYGQTPATWSDGDVTGDNIVDQADYTVWYNHYGQTGGNVPEPMTMALLAIGGVALLRRKK